MVFQKSFKALSDPTRREIVELLKQGKLSAGEISAHFPSSDATISHHLMVLKQADLVMDEHVGKYIYYELNMTVMEDMIGWFRSFKR